MEQNFNEATKPALDLEKKDNFFVRFLLRHPRLIIPVGGLTYTVMFGAMITLVIFVNK